MTHHMRAKVTVRSVERNETAEFVTFAAVAKSGNYPADGTDEDNTFAKFTPSAEFKMLIANPELHRTFGVGDKFYVDFHRIHPASQVKVSATAVLPPENVPAADTSAADALKQPVPTMLNSDQPGIDAVVDGTDAEKTAPEPSKAVASVNDDTAQTVTNSETVSQTVAETKPADAAKAK